jgi:hypothetical protein
MIETVIRDYYKLIKKDFRKKYNVSVSDKQIYTVLRFMTQNLKWAMKTHQKIVIPDQISFHPRLMDIHRYRSGKYKRLRVDKLIHHSQNP